MDKERDHLFISYAWEDSAFVDWLALKLTAAGYRVWRDQTKLLGGEPYPTDIDEAIKRSTFRLLAVLSRHSIHKPNPRKERTLALNLGRERGEPDFLIPLNIDGLKPTELDWMTSDLSFIPFYPSWSEGLGKLLKKLVALNAPKPLEGHDLVSKWVSVRDQPADHPERLWSNIFPILEMPPEILCVSSLRDPLYRYFENTPYVRQNDQTFWCLEKPAELSVKAKVESFPWLPPDAELSRKLVRLLRLYMWDHCVRRDLRRVREDNRTYCYFSPGEDGTRRLNFLSYSGKKSWVKAVGQRKFRVGPDMVETTRYHLSPDFTPRLNLVAEPAFCLSVHVHLTDEAGRALPPAKAFRRRKKICGSWWNHQWLSRQLAIAYWLSDAEEDFNLSAGAAVIKVSSVPYRLSSSVGIGGSHGDAVGGEEDTPEFEDSIESDMEDDEVDS